MAATGQELDHLFTRVSMDPSGFLIGAKQVEMATANLEKRILSFGASVSASLVPVTASLQGLTTVFSGVAAVVSGNASQAVTALSNALKDLQAPNTASVVAIGKALTALGTSLNQFGTVTAPLNLTNLAGELTGFSNALNTALNNSPNVKPFAAAMDKIANLLFGSMAYRKGRLGNILPELNDFATGFQSIAGRLANASVESASASLGKLGALMTATNRFKYDGKVFGQFSDDLFTLFSKMTGLPQGGMEAAAGMTGRLSSLVNSMAKINPGSVGGMTVAISTLFSGMTTAFGSLTPDAMNRGNLMIQRMGGLVKAAGTADPTKWGEMIKGIGDGFAVLSGINVSAAGGAIQSIRSLGNAVSKFTSVNPAVIMQTANAVRAAMVTLNSIPPGPNAARVANVMNRLGNSFKNMGGGTPPPTGTLLGGLGAVPPAANAASSSLAGVNNRMSTLSATSMGLASTINGVRLSLLGLAGFGIYSFAKVDDALRRTVANMTNMGTNEPGVYEFFKRGAGMVASRSTSSQLDLVNALGQLTAAGYSAGGAMDSLMTAENFAVASGMKLADATRRLVDLQAALGMGDEGNFDRTAASLLKLSDMMVLAAKRSGSTEAQIADAFTGKFTTAMKRVKMGAEEGMAVVSVLSKLNHSFRGAAGGDTAARAIGVITNAASQNADVWRGLGIQGINKDGSFSNLTDLLDQLHKFAGTDMAKGMSQLRLSGLGENLRVVTGVETLINYGKAIRQLTDEMVDAGGTSQRTADTVRGSLLSQLKMLWNNAQLTASVFGDALSPALSGLIGGLNGLLSSFVELNPAVQLLTVSGAALLVTYRPLVSLLAFALTPVTLLIGAVVSLGSAVIGTFVAATTFYAASKAWIVTQWSLISAWTVWGSIATASKTVWAGLTATLLVVGGAIKTVFLAFHAGNAVALFGGMAFKAFAAVIDRVVMPALDAIGAAFEWVGKVGSAAWGGMIYAVKGVLHVVELLQQMLEGSVAAFNQLGKGLMIGMVAVWQVVTSGLAAAASGVLTFLTFAVPAFLLLPPLVALVAAPIVTIGTGLYQLVGVIGGGLVRAWGAAKDAAVGALGWVGGKMTEIGEGVRSMWSSLRLSIVGFLNGVRPVIEYTSGLLWNYKYNLEVVFRWLNKYGEQAFKDLGNAAFLAIEAVAGNIQQMALFLGNVFVTVVSTLWSNLTRTGFSFFAWFRNQWTNILGDVNGLFMTFTSNLMQNFLVLAEAGYSILADMAKELATNPLGRTFATEALAKKYLAEKDAERQAVLNKAYQGLRGPLDGAGKSSTDFGMLANSLKHVWDVALPQQWDRAGKDMATAFSERFKQMNPVLAGFAALNKSPIWVELFTKLNGSLPNNALGEFGKWFMQMVKPDLDNKDEAGNAVPGGTNGPGFTFKQTSSARTMLGGEAAENLDFQQLVTLKQIKGILQDIAQAKGVVFDGNMPKFLKLKEGN